MTWKTRPRSELAPGVACIRAGDGPAVLLIHGVGLRAEAWAAQFAGLGASYSLLAVDLPGHGASAARPLAGLGDLVDWAANAARAIGRPLVVAGHSLGALVALEMALRLPDLVRGVAALNCIYRRSARARAAVLDRAEALAAGAAGDPGATLTRWFGADRASAPARACERWLRSVDHGSYAAAYRLFAEADAPPDARLAELVIPALFLTGANEPNSTPAMSRSLAALVPDGRDEIVEGAAHMLPMTHPGAVNAALTGFLTRCGHRDGY